MGSACNIQLRNSKCIQNSDQKTWKMRQREKQRSSEDKNKIILRKILATSCTGLIWLCTASNAVFLLTR